jgi:hypothetical protein
VLGGPIAWPLEQAGEVFRFLRDYAPEAPDELGIVFSTRMAPPAPFVPPDQFGKPVVMVVPVWAGHVAEGQKAIAPLRRLGTPIADFVRPAPYLFFQSLMDAGNPQGMHYYWRSQRLPTLTDDVIDAMTAQTKAIEAPLSYVGVRRTLPPTGTSRGCAKAGRPCAHTVRACSPTSSPTKAPPASRPPTASGWDG